jgi:predicted RNA-binding Zn ribbon-like protein
MTTGPVPRRERHEFRLRDFVAGHPAIDFVNTVTARNTPAPVDWLDSYDALLRWSSSSALATPRGAMTTPPDGADARAELRRCRELREAIHTALTAALTGAAVPAAAVTTLEANWRLAATHADLDLTSTPFRLRYDQKGPELSVVRRTLAVAAVDLLLDLPLERMRTCPGERCGWIFIDTSKAGRRRWCDMATCGTASKNRRRHAGAARAPVRVASRGRVPTVR